MIKIERGKEPEFLNSEIMELAAEKLYDFYSSKNRSQRRYNFSFNKEIDIELKQYLHNVFNGKCGYCEIEINSHKEGVIDRFRPHNGVRDKGEYHSDLYWWLTYEWDNLIYCCKECNQYKANYFPIVGKRVFGKSDDLAKEGKLLLNPCKDDPSKHFNYNINGEICAITTEGEQTLVLLNLNRDSLVQKRIQAKIDLDIAIGTIMENSSDPSSKINYLQSIYNDDCSIPFLAYKKWELLSELAKTPLLGQMLNLKDYEDSCSLISDSRKKSSNYISDITKINQHLTTNDYFPIEYIQIENFKSIDNIRIDFKEDNLDEKSWLFLLGENGVGKSSILQAIAVGLKSDEKIVKSLITRLIKKSKQRSIIEIKERNSNNIIRTILTRKDSSIQQYGEFKSVLIGYGSLRLSVDETDDNSKKNIKEISYENLFKPIRPLNDITKWLMSIHNDNPDFFDRIAYSIKQLLPDDFSDNELIVQKGEIMFKNSEKLFAELSDGFKSTITLAVDIMMKLSTSKADMDKMTGIVLIDELGNQLHPRWQMRVVTQLRTVFPNINFIISTHHPLCLRGSKNKEILLLKNINNEVVSIAELPNPSSMRVDQILASDFFGLNSLVDPEIEAKFNRYYELLAKNINVTQQEKEEVDALRDSLRNKQQLGTSLREELMYTVIDKLLAQKVIYNKKSLDRDILKDEVVKRVKEIWKTLNIYSND